jgi:hypothetical protein
VEAHDHRDEVADAQDLPLTEWRVTDALAVEIDAILAGEIAKNEDRSLPIHLGMAARHAR